MTNSIAKLIKLCVTSVITDYALDGSAASFWNIKEAFVDYFDYDQTTISFEPKTNYSDDEWKQNVYNDLKNKRPIIYCGYDYTRCIGHTFVIDGYDRDDYFHVNWGWGGSSDGYFLLTSLNGYNTQQGAIFGIQGKGEPISDDRDLYITLENGTLTFHYDNNKDNYTSDVYNLPLYYSNNEEYLIKASEITSVVIESSVADCHYITDTNRMFYSCQNLTSIQGLEYLDTKYVTDMAGMFYKCSSLTSPNLSNFDTQNVTNMSWMFSYCSQLNKIYVGEKWTTGSVTESSGMFSGCNSIIGQDGTKYDSSKNNDKTYAHYGTGGYLTNKNQTGIMNILDNGRVHHKPIKFFRIDGKLISQPQKGMNIQKMSDGTIRKIVVD